MPSAEHTTIATTGGFEDEQWIDKPVIKPDPAGFDMAEGTCLYRGTQAQLFASFPVGGTAGDAACPDAPPGSVMYCMGAQVQRREGTHLVASVSWRGIAVQKNAPSNSVIVRGAGQQVLSVALSATAEELTFPREYAGRTVIAPPPYCPSPKAGEVKGMRTISVLASSGTAYVGELAPYRVAVFTRVWGAQVRGITVADQVSVTGPPRLLMGDPRLLTGSPVFDYSKLPDFLVSWDEDNGAANGWFCTNWQPPSTEIPMGSKVMAFWTASYRYKLRYSQG